MAQYDNTNTFIFSRNDRRETDKHPEFTGTLNVDGVEYWMNGWIKERKDGTGKFFSGTVRAKDQKKPAAATRNPREIGPDFNDDIPF